MNAAVALAAEASTAYPRAVVGTTRGVLTDIYQDDVNMVIWQRDIAPDLRLAAEQVMHRKPALRGIFSVDSEGLSNDLQTNLGNDDAAKLLCQDIAELTNMFGCLFDLQAVGLRLTTLDRAMCPKFHTDWVPCRLITTYSGLGTEWLREENVIRGEDGSIELFDPHQKAAKGPIQTLARGEVALLKGERWHNNEQTGLVHRSPAPAVNEQRLILTLDFAS